MSETTLVEHVKRYAALRTEKDDLEAKLKAINAEITELSTKTIPTMMDDLEIPSLKVEGIGTVFQRAEVYASVLAERRDEFHAWLRENGHGDLIKDTVHPGTLKAFAKEQLTDGNPLPECIKATIISTAQIRKGK